MEQGFRLIGVLIVNFEREGKTKCSFRPCWLLGWRASRSSGVSRAKAGGEGSRTPVSCPYVQQRPRMLYQRDFRGKYVLMNKRGRRRMLLVLLLPWQSVWKHPKSQYWTTCFRDQNGRQRRISAEGDKQFIDTVDRRRAPERRGAVFLAPKARSDPSHRFRILN